MAPGMMYINPNEYRQRQQMFLMNLLASLALQKVGQNFRTKEAKAARDFATAAATEEREFQLQAQGYRPMQQGETAEITTPSGMKYVRKEPQVVTAAGRQIGYWYGGKFWREKPRTWGQPQVAGEDDPFGFRRGTVYSQNLETGEYDILQQPQQQGARGFTLSPGQARYDAQGNLIVQAPDTGADTKVKGRTGEVMFWANQLGLNVKDPTQRQKAESIVNRLYGRDIGKQERNLWMKLFQSIHEPGLSEVEDSITKTDEAMSIVRTRREVANKILEEYPGALYDYAAHKWYVMQAGRKYWIEEK